MKKECEYTRKSLGKYLHGHLFRLRKMRIDRHLRSCVVCRSEYEALKRAEETRLFMKDFEPAGGMASRIADGFSSLARLRKIFYRPLWLALIVVFAAAVYSYVVTPRQFDIELDSIVKTAPISTVAVSTAPSATLASVPAPAAIAPPAKPLPAAAPAPIPAPTPAVDPLTVIITVASENEKTAIRRINEVMRGNDQLRKKKFSDEVRELSGALTPKELLTFFTRIAESGKVSYSRKRFETFPVAQPVPFVLKLKLEVRTAERLLSPSRPVPTPTEAAAPAQRDAAPAQTPDR
jgi:hypothetical protein